MNSFNTYLTTLKAPADFSGTTLISIMDSFSPAFEKHFHAEIDNLVALARHPGAPPPNSPEEADAATKLAQWGRQLGQRSSVLHGVPFFLMNLDRTAEEGMWANWPPIPSPVRWGLVNIAGAWHSAWWKFASCDSAGNPRPLWALQFPEGKE
jgi:hypothetical protein